MRKEIKILQTTVNIGVEKPFKLLHVTDSHIALDDEGNDCGRQKIFDKDYEGCSQDYFIQAADYCKKQDMVMLNTGDFFDFLSEANFAFADEYLNKIDYIYAAGNHDFCHCVGKAKEDYEYKWNQIKRSAPYIKSNLYFDSRVINGVNIVTLDNSYYLMTDGQIEALRAEAAKGYPILLAMHNPLYNEKQATDMMQKGGNILYCVGAPEEILKTYPADRRAQQTPDDATLRAIKYIKEEPLIKAIVVGHLHRNFEETLENGVPQITTAGSYSGYVRELTII